MIPGDTIYGTVFFFDATGALVDPDGSVATIELRRNLVKDATATAGSVVKTHTGDWGATQPMPNTYVYGDTVEAVVNATVGGKAVATKVGPFTLTPDWRTIGEGGWTMKQHQEVIIDVLVGLRSGMPLPGVAGTINIASPTGVARGTITVDVNGNITAIALTPP